MRSRTAEGATQMMPPQGRSKKPIVTNMLISVLISMLKTFTLKYGERTGSFNDERGSQKNLFFAFLAHKDE